MNQLIQQFCWTGTHNIREVVKYACSCGITLSLAYHCSCVDQHEALISNLKYKLKNTEEELQTANKCENNNYAYNIYS